jgi:dATP pyrophosphohydrolase
VESIRYQPEYEAFGGLEAVGAAERHFTVSSRIALRLVAADISMEVRAGVAVAALVIALAVWEPDMARVGRLLAAIRDHWDPPENRKRHACGYPFGSEIGRGAHDGGVTETVDGRAAFQVLVLPYRKTAQGLEYALFRRADAGYCQGVAGGGQADESPLQAARREAPDEGGLVGDHEFVALDARATIPAVYVTGEFTWGPDVLVIPEYAFDACVEDTEVTLSDEHTEYSWFTLDAAKGRAVGFQPHRAVGTGPPVAPRHRSPSGLSNQLRHPGIQYLRGIRPRFEPGGRDRSGAPT